MDYEVLSAMRRKKTNWRKSEAVYDHYEEGQELSHVTRQKEYLSECCT